jgi:hypothetical protein
MLAYGGDSGVDIGTILLIGAAVVVGLVLLGVIVARVMRKR